jgi:hypothetical protein
MNFQDFKEFVNRQPVENTYWFNVQKLVNVEDIRIKDVGIFASAVNAFLREGVKPKENIESKHIGNIGDKIEIEVTFLGRSSFLSMYGESYIHRFKDENENILIWFSSSGFPEYIEPGTKLKIKATVKNHDDYQNKKQTIITRVKKI